MVSGRTGPVPCLLDKKNLVELWTEAPLSGRWHSTPAPWLALCHPCFLLPQTFLLPTFPTLPLRQWFGGRGGVSAASV